MFWGFNNYSNGWCGIAVRPRSCITKFIVIAAITIVLALTVESVSAFATVNVVLSEQAKAKLKKNGKNPSKVQKRLNDDFNRGLKELGKKHPGAKALFDSGQTIRIICAKSKEAKKLGINVGLSPAETHGDFDKKGKPRKGGQTIIAIKCGKFGRFGLDKPFFDIDPNSTAFRLLIHELLHATDKDRRHPPDDLDLYSSFVADFLKAIEAAKKAEKKSEKDQKNEQANSSTGSNRTSSTSAFTDTPFAITTGGQVGRLKRSRVSFLRTELGGIVVNSEFARISRNEQIAGLNFTAQVNLDPRPIMGKQVGLSPYFGVNNNYAESDVYIPNLSAMGNQLGILGVEGPTGPLGGGLITGAGFGDLTNGQYMEHYRETSFFFGLKGKISLDDILEEGIKPSLFLHGAFMYGNTREKSYFSGTTNVGTVNFRYDNLIKSDRFGLELGLKYKYPLNEDFGLYANGAVRFTHNKASGYTKLNADSLGAPFPGEYQSLSKRKFDVGGIVGAGIFADAGPLTGYAGVEGELWKVPGLQVTGTERARLEFKDRTSWTVKLGLRIDF